MLFVVIVVVVITPNAYKQLMRVKEQKVVNNIAGGMYVKYCNWNVYFKRTPWRDSRFRSWCWWRLRCLSDLGDWQPSRSRHAWQNAGALMMMRRWGDRERPQTWLTSKPNDGPSAAADHWPCNCQLSVELVRQVAPAPARVPSTSTRLNTNLSEAGPMLTLCLHFNSIKPNTPADPTQLDSCIASASASAVCIGH